MMTAVRLAEFIGEHRGDLLNRCKEKARDEAAPLARRLRDRGIPVFLDQVAYELSDEPTRADELRASALEHGRDLFLDGSTVAQLVHDYGAVCQSVTDLAVETGVSISTVDFRTLNRCVDDAIADAVAEYANLQRSWRDSEALRLRNLAYMALLWFDEIREGSAGLDGPTGDLLHKSLLALSDLANHRPM